MDTGLSFEFRQKNPLKSDETRVFPVLIKSIQLKIAKKRISIQTV